MPTQEETVEVARLLVVEVANVAAVSVQMESDSRLVEDGGSQGEVGVRMQLRSQLVHISEETAVTLRVRGENMERQDEVERNSRGSE